MALPVCWFGVLAKPVGMQKTSQEMASGDFATTATAAVQALGADNTEDIGLGGHASTLRRVVASVAFEPPLK
jgi:hypothetical protein